MTHESHTGHHHGQGQRHGHDHASGLPEQLDLDAAVFGSYLADVTAWARRLVPASPRTIVDLGAGTGTGSLALAEAFPTAHVVAVDKSTVMLERVRAAAGAAGLGDRVATVQADVDEAWPALGAVDVIWASSSLHEVADPQRVLRDACSALVPGGLMLAVEMDALPRFLPDDVGLGRPGLEARCHEALAQAGWNGYEDWSLPMERAGFDGVERRSFPIRVNPEPTIAVRYAQGFLGRIRSALDGRLSAEDAGALDSLLAGKDPRQLLVRGDLHVVGSRTAWAARRR
ncbi:class I SAM-dependent methyltransferase [Arthrobacter sp. 35W]|uniref:class I SAM-dependent methyltransferase n=1 Tax=Arthrobacter sp. 35W TaxID=1132441 RepID=UPI00047BEECD|nr:class I SAM-dependent methyltransferase [Arthrobacter sp. 35W]